MIIIIIMSHTCITNPSFGLEDLVKGNVHFNGKIIEQVEMSYARYSDATSLQTYGVERSKK